MPPEFSQTRQQPPLTFQLLNWMNTCRSYLTSQPLLIWWLFPLPWNYFLHHLLRFFYLGFILLWYSFLASLKLYSPPLPCKYSFYQISFIYTLLIPINPLSWNILTNLVISTTICSAMSFKSIFVSQISILSSNPYIHMFIIHHSSLKQ